MARNFIVLGGSVIFSLLKQEFIQNIKKTGAGDVGSKAVEELVATPGVELVTIADLNIKLASEMAEKLAKPNKVNVNAVKVNAFDHSSLVNAIRGHDCTVSALGPFHLFESRCVEASIEAGVDYCSVCDDWSAAQEVLDNFGEKAKEKGVQILTGLGSTPGISNIGVQYLSNNFEKVTDIEIDCFQPLDAGGGEAVLKHMLFIMSGNPLTFQNKKTVNIKACSQEKVVDMPLNGKTKLWNMGHAEPVTMPKYYKDVENVGFYMGFGKGSEFLTIPAKLGLFKFNFIIKLIVLFFTFIEYFFFRNKEPSHGSIHVKVSGENKGKRSSISLYGEAEMRGATGTSLAVGAIILAKKENLLTKEPGVYAPEVLIDAKYFLHSMQFKNFVGYEDPRLEVRHIYQ